MAGVSAEATPKLLRSREQPSSGDREEVSLADTRPFPKTHRADSGILMCGLMSPSLVLFLLPITKKFPDIVLYCMLIHSQQRPLLSTNAPEIKNRPRP